MAMLEHYSDSESPIECKRPGMELTDLDNKLQ